MDTDKTIRRGEIYYADFGNSPGAAITGMHPALIISNNLGNEHGPTVIVAAITSKIKKTGMPTHIPLDNEEACCHGMVMAEQVKTVDKADIFAKCGQVSDAFIQKVDRAVAISMGLVQKYNYV